MISVNTLTLILQIATVLTELLYLLNQLVIVASSMRAEVSFSAVFKVKRI